MSLVTNWITKLPRLKNSKVARFSYKAEAYANDDIEGVENYDYSRDMNIPLATHTDFDTDVLSIGARTHFSSVPKNGLNHFFGRVSYNLNKVLDFLVDFLTDFIALNDSFISFTEIVSFSSSATLSNYANGSTKRLLSTAGSNITITLPAGETYLGSNTITLTPSIMLTITKRGTVWVNSSGNAITADKWKTARNITISDADGTNTGAAVSVDGSENETLKLPATIKATLSGNATTATTATTATNALACSGNSATATKLATARTINGVSFDGSANITVADSTKAPTSHASSAITYGVSSEDNYGHAKASAVAGTANGTASKGTTPTVFAQSDHVHPTDNTREPTFTKNTAFNKNFETTASNIKANGTQAVGTSSNVPRADHVHPLQTSVSGNAGTATKLATARKINGVDFDGTADVYDTYSTTETRIGTWIDGKPIYRKVVDFGALPNNSNKSVEHGITNLKTVTSIIGVANSSSYRLCLPYLGSASVFIDMDNNVITIAAGSDRSAYSARIIIEYTKTTD